MSVTTQIMMNPFLVFGGAPPASLILRSPSDGSNILRSGGIVTYLLETGGTDDYLLETGDRYLLEASIDVSPTDKIERSE